MIKANKHGTVNRGQLLKLIAAGGIQAKCNFRFTDDYRFDNASNFGQTAWLPACIIADGEAHDFKKVKFSPWSFRTKSGMAWLNRDGTVTLKVHGNESWELRQALPETAQETK
jgi:hypothetical protein